MKRRGARYLSRLGIIALGTLSAILPAFAVAPDTVTATLTGITTPFSGAISPDGSYVYALGYSNSTLYKINATTTTLIKTVSLASSSANRQIHFLPDGSAALYIDYTNGTLVKINTATDAVVSTASVGTNPNYFVISPDGNYAYIGLNGLPTNVKRYLTSDLSLDTTYNIAVGARFIAISPDGNQGYAIGTTQVIQFNTATGVTASPLTIGTCASLNSGSYTINGGLLYLLCASPSASVYRINTSTNSLVGSPITLTNSGYMMSVSPEGSFIYIQSFGANAIFRLRLSDNTITSTISTGSGPYSVIISSDATFAYSFNYGASSVNRIYTGAVIPAPVSARLSAVGGGNTVIYRTGKTIRFTITSPATGADGLVTFYQNAKRIGGCINISSSAGVADCIYKPTIHGAVTISAKITPASPAYLNSTSLTLPLNIVTRTGNR